MFQKRDKFCMRSVSFEYKNCVLYVFKVHSTCILENKNKASVAVKIAKRITFLLLQLLTLKLFNLIGWDGHSLILLHLISSSVCLSFHRSSSQHTLDFQPSLSIFLSLVPSGPNVPPLGKTADVATAKLNRRLIGGSVWFRAVFIVQHNKKRPGTRRNHWSTAG